MADGMSALDLAADLGMLQPDDVQWLLSEHLGVDLHDDVIPTEWVIELRWILDPTWERTAPAHFYWHGHAVDFDPRTGEGNYEGVFDW